MEQFRLSPESLKALRRAGESIQAWSGSEAVRAIGAAVEVSRERLEALTNTYAAAVQPLLEAGRSQIASLAPLFVDWAARASEMLKRAFPPNWVGLEPDEIRFVIERVRETGFTLVWIPRIEIVRELLAANTPDTATMLLAHRNEVLDDAGACLQEVTDPDLAPTREVIEQAIAALRCGLSHPAQAAAAAAFTSEGHELFGTTQLRTIQEGMEESDPEEAFLNELRLSVIYAAGAKALKFFSFDSEAPAGEFNRHATSHWISSEQWTEANALSAIMLATALLREMEYWCSLERMREDQPNSDG